jgi:hypothetical protein
VRIGRTRLKRDVSATLQFLAVKARFKLRFTRRPIPALFARKRAFSRKRFRHFASPHKDQTVPVRALSFPVGFCAPSAFSIRGAVRARAIASLQAGQYRGAKLALLPFPNQDAPALKEVLQVRYRPGLAKYWRKHRRQYAEAFLPFVPRQHRVTSFIAQMGRVSGIAYVRMLLFSIGTLAAFCRLSTHASQDA